MSCSFDKSDQNFVYSNFRTECTRTATVCTVRAYTVTNKSVKGDMGYTICFQYSIIRLAIERIGRGKLDQNILVIF